MQKTKFLLIIFTTFLLYSCASTTKITVNGQEASPADPNLMWEDGLRMLEDGEKLLKKGEDMLFAGRAKVRQGEEQVRMSNEKALLIKEEYQTKAAHFDNASATATDRQEHSEQLKKIGKQWADAIADIKAGNSLVDRGNKEIRKAQSVIREGRVLMDEGSLSIRNSQRQRHGEKLLRKANTA